MNNNNLRKSYYAVIPADVRYDKNLPLGARLLYGEITALCGQEGYCWAGNSYFSELYGVNERTIKNWINALKNSGYISVNYAYVPGKKEIESRQIRITCSKAVNYAKANKNSASASDSSENAQNSRNNNESNNKEAEKNSSGGGEKNFPTYGKNFPEVGKKSSGGGENNCPDNTTINNTNNTAAAPAPEPEPDEPLPTVEKAAAAALFDASKIKEKLKSLDNTLFFDGEFYSKAVNFFIRHNLDYDYLDFIHKKLKGKKKNEDVHSPKGYFFKIFFLENNAEEYLAAKNTPPEKTSPGIDLQKIVCPVCGSLRFEYEPDCPFCMLPSNPSDDDISIYKKIYFMPASLKNEYLSKEKEIILNSKWDINKYTEGIENLRKEYGVAAG